MTYDGHTASMSIWLATAAEPTVVRRALGTAVVVGAALIAINHGDAIVVGAVDGARVLKMALTVLVPYCVSTASSVGAIMERSGASQSDTTRPGASTGLVKKGTTR